MERERVPAEVRHRLEFLWRSAGAALAAEPPQPQLARALAARLVVAAAAHRVMALALLPGIDALIGTIPP